jgi:hypothetical protein
LTELLATADSGLILVHEMLLKHPLGLLAVWAFIPVIGWSLTWGRPENSFSVVRCFGERSLKVLRSLLISAVCLASVLVFANWLEIRDSIGQRYVQGYSVTHVAMISEYGPSTVSVARADSWQVERAILLFELFAVVGFLGFPALTSTLTKKAVALHRQCIEYDCECERRKVANYQVQSRMPPSSAKAEQGASISSPKTSTAGHGRMTVLPKIALSASSDARETPPIPGVLVPTSAQSPLEPDARADTCYCGNCGGPLRPGDYFGWYRCPHCGHSCCGNCGGSLEPNGYGYGPGPHLWYECSHCGYSDASGCLTAD